MFDWLIDLISAPFERFRYSTGLNKAGWLILGVVVVVLTIILMIFGLGFLSALALALILVVVILLGGISEVAFSVAIIAIVKIFASQLTEFVRIWTANGQIIQSIDFFSSSNFFDSVFVFLLPLLILRTVTRSIKIFNVSSSAKVYERKKDKETNKEK